MSSFMSRVAAAPISWGICEAPGWGLQLPVDRVLDEARQLGITAIEQGALGWLPTDPDEQEPPITRFEGPGRQCKRQRQQERERPKPLVRLRRMRRKRRGQ